MYPSQGGYSPDAMVEDEVFIKLCSGFLKVLECREPERGPTGSGLDCVCCVDCLEGWVDLSVVLVGFVHDGLIFGGDGFGYADGCAARCFNAGPCSDAGSGE